MVDKRCQLTNKRNGISCGDGKVCYRGTCCTPTCAGKQCGTNGCGESCGTCVAPQTCRSGRCSCGDGKDLCGGVCRDACPGAQIYNPNTCICCHPNGTVFPNAEDCFDAGCCADNDNCMELTDGSGRYACQGRHGGDPCTFDAQCASGQCFIHLGSEDRSCL